MKEKHTLLTGLEIDQANSMCEREFVSSGEISDLLSTKFALPRTRPSLVPREPLLARLDTGLDRRLTLLSAPAGFGKTTLASAWITSRYVESGRLAAAWLSLDAGDNDPLRFWRYLIAACRQFDANMGDATLALLQSPRRLALETPPQCSFEAALTAFINELALLSRPCVLVLDDYHVIVEPQIHTMVAYLVDHLPATFHLMALTRSNPPLPLARWRAHSDLCELRAADLRFSQAETTAFFRTALAEPLTEEALTCLQARTEGWAAALNLVALALQERRTPQECRQFLATFTGSHRHIVEFLIADVLNAQPEPLHTFLLQTSVLPRLTAPLCDAVTGQDNSATVLQQIERANLFLEPPYEAGRWYRYHPLFAEAMQHEARLRFGEAALRDLLYRASEWYEQHDLLAEATDAALDASDYERAAVIMEQIARSQRYNEAHQYHTLHRRLEQLPQEVLWQHPALCLTYAVILLFVVQQQTETTRARFEALLQRVEQVCGAEGNQTILGWVRALRSLACWRQGDPVRALGYGKQALAWLPDDEIQARGMKLSMAAAEEVMEGAYASARRSLLQAQALYEAAENRGAARAMRFLLGDVLTMQGELYEAAELYRQVLSEAQEDLSDRSAALIGLASLSYEWNDLDRAEQEAQAALAFGKQIGEASRQVRAALILARVLQARREIAQARQMLHALATQTQQMNSPLLHREVRAYQARLALAEGDLAATRRWSAAYPLDSAAIPLIQQEQEELIIVRLSIAQGEIEPALHRLDRLQAEAQRHSRTGRELEIVILTAVAACHCRPREAKQMLVGALELAQSAGYCRIFLNEGKPLAALLRAALPIVNAESMTAYIQTLLDAFDRESGEPMEDDAPASLVLPSLFEPLSPQERRVLRLLAAGHTTPTIAKQLFVSVNTVRTQVQSIYRKLDVNNRVAACETARRLQLL